MERRERVSWLWLAWLCAGCAGWVCVVQAVPCEREDKEGCNVTAGHAHCTASDLRAIERLPACTTNITFSWFLSKISSQNLVICLGETVNFTHLPHLQELTLLTDSDTYDQQRLIVHVPKCLNTSLQSLRVFRYRGLANYCNETEENAGMYAHFKKLDTLELTRADKPGLLNIMHLLGPEPSVKTLVLKNVQSFGALHYTPVMDLAYFVCGGEVEWLDLRYNDIVTINVTTSCWSTKLKYLNLDHNILAQTVPKKYFWITVFPMLSGLQILRASPDGSVYQDGLWEDSEETDVIDYSHDPKLSSTELSALALLEETPVGFLAGFDFWLKDVVKPCQGITYLQLVKCAVSNYHDTEALYLCLDPNVNSYNCTVRGPYAKLICLLLRNCNYSCEMNIPLPLPTKLRDISMRNMLHFDREIQLFASDKTCKSNEIRIHPNNEVQVLDMHEPYLHYSLVKESGYSISGLKKLRYINLQGHHVPFLFSEMTISDLTALEELHIGGDRVSQQDIVRSHTIEGLPKLSLFNLSYSKIRGIDNDALVTQNRLSVLDLSHNELTAPALASLDLSHTRLRSLNLSHNQLTSVPPSLRQQLQLMEGLEVYLSGNTFICSCDNLAFLEWIQSDLPITFHYAGDHVCADSPGNTVHNIAVDSLYCNWFWQMPLVVLAAVLGLGLLVAVPVMVYRRRYHIGNLIVRLQERWWRNADATGPSNGCTYDAFVSYSNANDDRLWVHYLLQKTLEKEFGFRLCIHHRNFTPGEYIVTNIEKAIRHSRKVVLVMSPDFVQSHWCIEEVQMTQTVDRSKLVVIMYRDVPANSPGIPAVIRALLQTTTYIEWPHLEELTLATDRNTYYQQRLTAEYEPKQDEKLFWRRLRKELYNTQRTQDNPDLLLCEIQDSS